MTDDELRAIVANLALAQIKTDEQFAKTDEKISQLVECQARTDEQSAKTDEKISQLVECQARTDEQLAKIEEKINKLVECQARTDEQLAKIEEKINKLVECQARTDAQLAKTDAQLAKTDAQLAKTDAQLAKTDIKLKKLADLYGGVGNNQGKVAEEFFYHSLKHSMQLNDIRFDFIEKNVTRSKGNLEEEYDLLLINGKEIFIVEVKYRLHPKDIDGLLHRKRVNFLKLFPEYRDYRIHLALASFAIDDDVKRMALDQGITVLQRRGKVIETFIKHG